ncbi:glycosyltransferase family 2 protein, partial [Aquipuribacter sp. SD81]|uniref:glycosyltransferase family 2 protein n=1 Tax=Aquipuribacter sp. SD81 TaxID=3127703 RepID=UPI00301AB61C
MTPPRTGAGTADAAVRPHVTAVLVCHDGARWLPRTLAALAGSDRRPDVVVAVDAGSRDSSPVLLDAALLAAPVAGDRKVVDAVVTVPRRTPLGESVRRGLQTAAEVAADTLGAGAGVERAGAPGWVWLLHDDCAPEPAALDQLLAAVAAAPTIAVAGCKQRGWDDPHRLVEVGATVTPGGRRLTEVNAGDLDQGQLDGRGDVLVVSTAGMLVRADVLTELGGLDPALPLVGDDVDLCVRARRAGYRVSVVPSAVVRHAAALESGQREATALRGRWGRGLGAAAPRAGGPGGGLTCARRAHWLHTRLTEAPLALAPLLLVWVVLVTPLRAAVWLARRRPGYAWAELAALAHLLAHLHLVVRSRWRSRHVRAVPSAALRPLRPTRAQVLRDEVDAYRVRRALARRPDESADDDTVPLEALESGPVDDDLIDLDLGAGGPLKRVVRHPLTYLVPLLALLGAVPWLRGLLAPPVTAPEGEVAGGPAAGELWARALTDWRDVGVGTPAPADPATAVWATLTSTASLLGGDGWAGSDLATARGWVVALAPVLSLLAAWAAARTVVPRRLPVAALATTWAVLPATGLLGTPRAGTLLVHVLLPLLAVALLACLGRRPLRATAVTGLLATVVVALSPATWLPLLVAATVVGALGGWRARATWRAVLPVVGALLPAPLLAPWAVLVPAAPRLLLVDPVAADPSATALPTLVDLAPRARAVLWPAAGGSGAPDPVDVVVLVVVGLAVLAVCLAALLVVLSLSRARVPAAWAALGVGASALAAGALALWQAGLEPAVPASAAALAGLLVAALLLRDLHDPDRAPARRDTPARRRTWWLAGVAGAVVPTGVVAAAVAVAVLAPLPGATGGLPAAALVGSGSELATRTLVITERVPDGTAGRAGDEPAQAGALADEAAADEEPVQPPVLTWATTSGLPGPGQDSVARLVLDGVDRAGDARLATAVEALLGEPGTPAGSVAAALAQAGVGWVVLSGPEELETAVAQRAGLVRTAVTDGRSTWRVDAAAVRDAGAAEPARARIEDGDEPVVPLPLDGEAAAVPAGGEARVLVLAENAHPGWRATLDGAGLEPVRVAGWAQGFELPADGGRLELRGPTVRPDAVLLSLGAAVVVLLLLLWPAGPRPVRRWDGRRAVPRGPRARARTAE